MSSNTTRTFSDYLPQLLNGSPGLIICFGNGLLLLTILKVKSLRKRKEMWMVMGLAMADFLYGLGNCSLALYRIILMILDKERELTTALECIVLPPVFLTYIGSILVALMNGVISIDRYMAVAWPTHYRHLGRAYVFKRLYRFSQCPLSGCPAGLRGPLFWPVVAMRHWAMVDAMGRASAGLSRGPVAGIFAA
uniref:G-protein coupled receptors family 1 profile domain-containing protein n=1 Tax=Plectus sambesii TaxID=2011161 RepID=A0A914XNF0_9BILA